MMGWIDREIALQALQIDDERTEHDGDEWMDGWIQDIVMY